MASGLGTLDISRWKECLWDFVEQQYQPAQRLFICIDALALASMMAKMLEEESCTVEEAERDFLRACSEYITIRGNRATISNTVFTKMEDGRSMVICYAAQQILAAEKMTNDEQVSADSYYPRYRTLLGFADNNLHQCPISYQQFRRIWCALEKEILTLPNASPRVISFEPGAGLKNRYRNYPLSQALLSLDDLDRATNALSDHERLSDTQLLFRLQSKSYLLSARGKSKVFNNPLSKPIVSQVRDHLSQDIRPPVQKVKKYRSSDLPSLSSLYVVVEDDGWEDYYCIRSSSDKYELDVIIDDLVSRDGAVIFREDEQLLLVGTKQSEPLVSGESILIVARRRFADRLADELANVFGTDSVMPLLEVQSDLSEGFSALYCRAVPQFLHGQRFLDFGKRQPVVKSELEFIGGLMVNRQNSTFLIGYPPTGLLFGGNELPGSSEVFVNGLARNLDEFLASLKVTTTDSAFRVEFCDKQAKMLMRSSRDFESSGVFGTPLSGGCFDARYRAKLGLSNKRLCFLGFENTSLFEELLCQRIAITEIKKHFAIPIGHWVAMNPNNLELVCGLLDKYLKDHPLKDKYFDHIAKSQTAPPTLSFGISDRC